MSKLTADHFRGTLNRAEKSLESENFARWWQSAIKATKENKTLLVFEVPDDKSDHLARKIEELIQEELRNSQ